MSETPTFEEIARVEKARRQLARILRQHLEDEPHHVGVWLPEGWQHAAVDAILTDRVSTLEALGMPAADAIARAIMTSGAATPPHDDDTARRLVADAHHLHTNGQHAPGGGETWADWERRAEAYLRGTEDGR